MLCGVAARRGVSRGWQDNIEGGAPMEDAVASGARPWRTQWRLVNVVEGGSLLGRDVDSSDVSFSKTYLYLTVILFSCS